MKNRFFAVFILHFLSNLALATSDSVKLLEMKAETSHWLETGRAEESERLCHSLQKVYPEKVKCESFGVTPEGRKLLVLIVSGKKAFTPEEAKKRKLPVVWIQAGIHSGEIEGKDAGYAYVKKQLALPEKESILNSQVILFCPILNVDGHERFGKWNRPNQNGPREMGWRVNSQNLNLNRDYLKLDTSEVEASLRYLNRWDAAVWVDLHTTDGAQFQHDISVVIPSVQTTSGSLQKVSETLQEKMMVGLKARGHLPLWFYPDFVRADEPMSGIEHVPALPKMGYYYWSYRNRVGILVETHSWKSYADRALATEHMLEVLMKDVSDRGSEYIKAITEADLASEKLAGTPVTLTWNNSKKSRVFDFLGYKYSITKSEVSGKNWIRYEPENSAVWKIPLWDEIEKDLVITAPKEGYWVDAAVSSWVARKLDSHAIHYQKLNHSLKGEFEVFRAPEIEFSSTPYESHFRATWKGQWKKESLNIPSGSLFIPSTQKNIRLALYLLEPQSGDSLSAWGFLNAFTEQKEYVEDYVLEEFALEQLKNPDVKKVFEEKLTDPKFKASSEKRLSFFYELHPAYDTHYRRLPFFKR